MKKAAIFFLGALAGVTALSVANASDDPLGTVKAGHSYIYAFASTKPPATFSDTVDFDLGKGTFSVTDLLFGFGTKGLTVTLVDLSNPLMTFAPSTSPFQSYDLGKGDYQLDITGKTTGPKGSSSIIFGDLSVAAVPEPATLAMMLAGAGLLAVYQWRRRGKSTGQSLSEAS
jgi:PEP-CTERM motif